VRRWHRGRHRAAVRPTPASNRLAGRRRLFLKLRPHGGEAPQRAEHANEEILDELGSTDWSSELWILPRSLWRISSQATA
jgi:hypothetical protein